MKKNAFTLIELLAVIVILSIIALIAVPIVINIISDAKINSQKRSIDNYAKALEQAVANYQLKSNKAIYGKLNTTDGKILTRDDITLNVNYKGNVVCNRIIINKDGSIYISECTVDGTKVDYEYGKTTYGMIKEREDKTYGWYFFDLGFAGFNISQFSIHNKIDIPKGYESKDFSYNQDGSVICYWKELEDKPGYYDLHLASDGEIYTPYDSTYLFAYVGTQKDNFKFDLTGLNTSKTTNMSHMFEGTASNARPKDINFGDKFDTSNVTDMSYMFKSAFQMPQNDDGSWYSAKFKLPNSFNTSKVTNMSHMFDGGFYHVQLLDLNNLDTSNVTDMSYMFADTMNILNLDLGNNFNTSKVINMSFMFKNTGYGRMKNLSLGDKFDTSNVTNMEGMFDNCGRNNLTYLDLGTNFDTSKVTNMSNMFSATGFEKLTSLNLGDNFDTSNVTNMSFMFVVTGEKSMSTLNLGKRFVIQSGTNTYSIFENCGTEGILTKVIVPNADVKLKIESLTSPNDIPQFWKDNDIIEVGS